MDNAEIFILTDSDGQEHEFQELFSFDSEDFQRSYIILEPVDEAETQEIGVLPFIYEKDAEEGMLQPIETDDELAMVEEVMNTIFNDPKLR